MAQAPVLPLPDYQRIYQVAYSVLQATGSARSHRACIFFATAGTILLREHYRLPATIGVGCLALMVDEPLARVAVYGRKEGGVFVNDGTAFHAWVECEGWLIDFMAPIMGIALREDGLDWSVPRRMLQKRMGERKSSLAEIQHVGDFHLSHDRKLAEEILDRQPIAFSDMLNVVNAWYRRPPKPLKDLAMADSHGPARKLVLSAPSIEGIW